MAVEFRQSLPLHLELLLRILLEHLGVRLTKKLGDPLVGHAAGAKPRGVGGAQVA